MCIQSTKLLLSRQRRCFSLERSGAFSRSFLGSSPCAMQNVASPKLLLAPTHRCVSVPMQSIAASDFSRGFGFGLVWFFFRVCSRRSDLAGARPHGSALQRQQGWAGVGCRQRWAIWQGFACGQVAGKWNTRCFQRKGHLDRARKVPRLESPAFTPGWWKHFLTTLAQI